MTVGKLYHRDAAATANEQSPALVRVRLPSVVEAIVYKSSQKHMLLLTCYHSRFEQWLLWLPTFLGTVFILLQRKASVTNFSTSHDKQEYHRYHFNIKSKVIFR